MKKLRLGVNIDHVATLRNARGGVHPCPIQAAQQAVAAGADGITLHLREDRRHIRDADLAQMRASLSAPINLELAATNEMQKIALKTLPNAVCIVPESREERTTEGGLDVAGQLRKLSAFILPLKQAGIRISLFVAPDLAQIEAAKIAGADIVEIHTGHYANLLHEAQLNERKAIENAAQKAYQLGLEVHAGHGLTYENVSDIAAITQMRELNIGHFMISQAVFDGLDAVMAHMRRLMDAARESHINISAVS
jgi:pyridoxine 5-phosphate synthase